MSRRTGVTAVDVLVVFVILIVIAVILFPVFSKSTSHGHFSNCQSNMIQIGRAIKMYLSDWDDTYPTQYTKPGIVSESVRLSPYDKINQRRFVYGKNWVEALFNYVEATNSQEDSMSVWRCNECSRDTYPEDSDTAVVSYVFNRNLIQLPEGYITTAGNMMMVREADRLVNSDLRPTNLSRKNKNAPPQSPFLTKRDVKIGVTKLDLHNKGSHILFADGHVKYFDPMYVDNSPQWDSETQQWWNSVDGQPGIKKTIAITP